MVNFIPKPAISVKERREEKGAGGPRAAQLIQLLERWGGRGAAAAASGHCLPLTNQSDTLEQFSSQNVLPMS